MNIETRTIIYTTAIIIIAAVTATAAASLWPITLNTPDLPLVLTIFAITTLAGRFPIRLSRQAYASLIVVPIFMAALMMHPTLAVIIAAASSLISELLIKAPKKAIAFNSGVNSLAAGLGGIVFFSLRPDGAALSLSAQSLMAAAASGLSLLITNLVLVDAMVTLRKGMGFWTHWKNAFTFESIQEGGLLPVGLIAALLASQEWWSPFIVMIPAVLAYYGFHHTVSEAAQKAELAEQLQLKITQLTQLQAQLVQSAKMASIGSLATGIAHEINNPVFAISGRADLLIRSKDKHLKSEKAEEYVENILQMTERISDITRHLMEYAQPADEMKEVMLNEVMESAITLMGKKVSRVRLVRDYEGLSLVNGVPSQLQQVFVNLLSNAVEASAEWGSVTLGCRVEGDEVVAYVRDEGVGMSDEVKDRLFEPFVSTKDVDSRVGLGLGMYTCHRVVESHSGRIEVLSQQGIGTTITIALPAAISTESELDFVVDEDAEFENIAAEV